MADPDISRDLELYAELLDMLTEDDHLLAEAIANSADICDADVIAKLFVLVFESRGKTIDLLERAIRREVGSTEHSEVLFRGNSLASKMMTVYSRLLGMDYLKKTLWPVMSGICQSDGSWEVDPNRAREGDNLEENCTKVIEKAEELLADIIASIEDCPLQFRQICHELMDSVDEKFPDAHFRVVGGYFFLRFMCPAIVSPPAYQLMASFPKKTSHRGLVLVAKLLQNLANGVPFLVKKEPYMLLMNDFIQENTDRMNAFFENLAIVPIEIPDLPSAEIEEADLLKTCQDFQRYLSSNMDKIVFPDGREDKAAMFEDIMRRLQRTTAKRETAKQKLQESDEDVGNVLNVDIEWNDHVRHPCVISIDLISRVKTLVETNSREDGGGALEGIGEGEDAALLTSRATALIESLDWDPVEWVKISNSIDYREFTLDAAELQAVDLEPLERKERICFWINVYNTLLIHARVVFGRNPRSVFQKRTFFSTYRYRVAGHEFSLDDLLHGIMRGNPRYQIKRRDPRMSFVEHNYDPRIHFALSQLHHQSPVIRIYRPVSVFKQLLYAAEVVCAALVEVHADRKLVILPKFFQLYPTDFGSFKADVFRCLALWLSEYQKSELASFLKTGKYTIEYTELDTDIPKVPLFEDEDSSVLAMERAAVALANADEAASTSGSAGPSDDDFVVDDASDESGFGDEINIDLEELWVLNVTSVWNDDIRDPVLVSAQLLSKICRVCHNYMFGWRSIAGSQDFNEFTKATVELQKASIMTMSDAAKTAFFINVYNMLVIHLYIIVGPPTSIFSRKSFFAQKKYNIGGYSFTLDDMYHGVLRNAKKHFRKNDPRRAFAMDAIDPRVHFALSNLSQSAGPVRCLTVQTLEEQLTLAAEQVVEQHLEIKPEKNKIYLPKVVEQYQDDFGKNKTLIYSYVQNFIQPAKRDLIAQIPAKKLKIRYRAWVWTPDPRFEMDTMV